MKYCQCFCKTALSSSKLPGLDYSINPYIGCEHNCAYCYAPYFLRINRDNWGTLIKVKMNLPLILSKELKRIKPGVVGLSTVTDPYQQIEKNFQITKLCLEQLLRYDFPIHIQTKSSLIIRDANLISKFSKSEVMVSIGTMDDNQRKILEPNSSSIKERFNILKFFSDIGVKTSVFFGPIYPTINKENLIEILNSFVNYNASVIMIDFFRIKGGIWNCINSALINNSNFLEIFSNNILKNKKFNTEIRELINDFSIKNNVKIIDAF